MIDQESKTTINLKVEMTPKKLGDRIIELTYSLQVIRDSINLIRNGNLYQIIPLCGQLRSLLTDKARKNKPLLIDLAKKCKKQLSIYFLPDVAESKPPLIDGLIFHMCTLNPTLTKELQIQEKGDLIEFLDKKSISYKNHYYSIKEVIQYYANKAGGSHYATTIPLGFYEMRNIDVLGRHPLDDILVQIGQITLELGTRLLKELTDFEYHISLFIPDQKIEREVFIIDNKHPESPMRFFLAINLEKKLVFGLAGLDNTIIITVIEQPTTFDRVFHFASTLSIENDISSKVNIYIDDDCVTENTHRFPVMTIPAIEQYNSYINRAFDQESAGTEFGVGNIRLYGRVLQHSERNSLGSYFKKVGTKKEVMFYSKGSYGYSAAGGKDIKNSGEVKIKTIST